MFLGNFENYKVNKLVHAAVLILNETTHFGVFLFEKRDDLYQELLRLAKPGDRIVLMGARDNSITDMGYTLLENLK